MPLPRMQYITAVRPTCSPDGRPGQLQLDGGAPKQFYPQRSERAVTGTLCAEGGTHLVARPTVVPDVVEGRTLDDPSLFGSAEAITHRQAGFPPDPGRLAGSFEAAAKR